MITIKELEKKHIVLEEKLIENNSLYEQQKDSLFKLMEQYQEIARWYLSKGFTNSLEYRREIGDVLVLAEHDQDVYYWDPEELKINKFNLRDYKNMNGVNSLIFVKKGLYNSARDTILSLDSMLNQHVESIEKENRQLKNDLGED
ncbi:hypothetical protein [Gracilibacillus lacisalsi]|uniref:hypothetical protein n=1 Tax=Gracilibacillus lacisalsi TaxID=393087 RepID=UPI000360CAE0|nr:hypothetical protein [Gracilibacillus lacisalsi]